MAYHWLDHAINKAERLMQRGKFQAALKKLLGICEIDPGNREVTFLIGECYLCLGKEELAIKPLRWALKQKGKKESFQLNWEVHYLLGCAYLRLNQFKRALIHLENSNKICPGNSEILRNIGWIQCILGNRNIGRALIMRAIYLDPGNAYACNDLGATYLEENNTAEAAKWIYLAYDICPEDAYIQETNNELQNTLAMQTIFKSDSNKKPKFSGSRKREKTQNSNQANEAKS